jgi:hypothetical protein
MKTLILILSLGFAAHAKAQVFIDCGTVKLKQVTTSQMTVNGKTYVVPVVHAEVDGADTPFVGLGFTSEGPAWTVAESSNPDRTYLVNSNYEYGIGPGATLAVQKGDFIKPLSRCQVK